MRVFLGLLLTLSLGMAADSDDLAKSLGISFSEGKEPAIVLQRDGKAYLKPIQTVINGVPFGRPYQSPFSVK